MSDHSIHTNKLNTGTIIKMCMMGLLVCGFIYSCSNAKSKKNKETQKTLSHQSNNVQAEQVAKQKGSNAQTRQAAKQTDSQSPTKKKKKIAKNWKTFFSGETETQTRIHLLQHGQKFTEELKSFSQSEMAQKASASINGIKLNNDTTATVSYTINIGGAPVLKDKTGKAFYLDDAWKVGAAAFCGLIELSGNTPEPCRDIGQ